jgi:carbonic anhydrase
LKRVLLASCLISLAFTTYSTQSVKANQPEAQTNQVKPQANQVKEPAPGDANASLQALIDGNNRYVGNKMIHPHLTAQRRAEVAKGQFPFATILSCSDSRVPPELVFDQGLGDLFIARVAGNVVSDEIFGSLEYAAEHLHVPLIVVMGHENCGAVEAAVKGVEEPGHINSLVDRIAPAVTEAKKHNPSDLLDESIRVNVKMVVEQIRKSQPILAAMIQQGKVKVVGARYDLDTGKVEFL